MRCIGCSGCGGTDSGYDRPPSGLTRAVCVLYGTPLLALIGAVLWLDAAVGMTPLAKLAWIAATLAVATGVVKALGPRIERLIEESA